MHRSHLDGGAHDGGAAGVPPRNPTRGGRLADGRLRGWPGVLLVLSLAPPCLAQERAGAPEAEPLRVTLVDCVSLALKGNRTVQRAFLDRIAQQFDYRVARHEFAPLGTLAASGRKESMGDGTLRSDTVQVAITQAVPTGGQVAFAWDGGASGSGGVGDRQSQASWDLTLSQPLLRGAGTRVGTANLYFAGLAEEANVLSLRSAVMSVVTSVIVSFRQLILAEREVTIRRSAYERSGELLEINRELIAAGRMAEVELVQAQASLKSQELAVVTSENSLEGARLALLQLLALDTSTVLAPVAEAPTTARPPALAEALELAFANRPDFLQMELNLESAERSLFLAKNNRLWELTAEAGLSNSLTGSNWSDVVFKDDLYSTSDASWFGALRLGIPLNDLSRKQSLIHARITLEKTKLDLADQRDNIQTEVRNAVRNAEVALRQLEIAREGRALSEQKLEIEREKLRLGRSTNFQVVNFQNDLVDAETSELSAAFAYLNALTYLDQTLGTTLATWGIDVRATDTTPPAAAPPLAPLPSPQP